VARRWLDDRSPPDAGIIPCRLAGVKPDTTKDTGSAPRFADCNIKHCVQSGKANGRALSNACQVL